MSIGLSMKLTLDETLGALIRNRQEAGDNEMRQ